MNLVYLSPHYPEHFSLFPMQLHRHGIKVFGITDQRDENLSLPLQEALTGHYRVDRLENINQIFEACDHFQRAFGSIDRVESHLEPWIELEGEIRRRYNMFGLKTSDLGFVKRKSLMKRVFEEAGIPAAKGAIVKDFEQCLGFCNGLFPVFIKPDIGVGASDTYTIRSEEDLLAFFAKKQEYPYFIEEFLDGIIESFDGLTNHDGEVVFFTSHIFNEDIHKIVSRNLNCNYYSQRNIPEDLKKYGHQVVKAAGIKEKFFHVEFFRRPNGALYALEINMRPPGGLTTHMFNYSSDVDVYEWWAAVMAEDPGHRAYERPYHCAYVGRKFDRGYAHSHEDIFRRFGAGVVHSQNMNPIEFSVMGSFAYLVRTPNIEELREMIRFIQEEASA